MAQSLRVFILGAGCSVCGGYPLAKDVPASMRLFADGLSSSAEKIRNCVNETLKLMAKHDVVTIDQLAQNAIEASALNDAKIAMAAHFLSIEESAAERAFSRYSLFFDELFGYGSGRSLSDKIKSTPCRVLSFNYDRLFERTFLRWAGRFDPQNLMLSGTGAHRLLNNGLGDILDIPIHDDQFSFLKLHGGVGQSHRNRDGGFRYPYWPELDKPIPEMVYANFYSRKHHEGDRPLLVFPNEKLDQLHGEGQNEWSFHRYTSLVWKAAKYICEEATEIRLIGYSMQSVDRFYFKEYLLKPANKCQRIVIENRTTEKADLLRQLRAIQTELGASWQIEFEETRF